MTDDKIRFKICIITDNEARCFVYSNVVQKRFEFDSNIWSISSFNLNLLLVVIDMCLWKRQVSVLAKPNPVLTE